MAQTPAKKVQTKGNAIQHTPVAAVTAGDVVLIGAIPHIADGDIAAGALGNVSSEGIYSVPKDSSVFAAGDPVYWNATGSPVVGTASSGAATSTPTANLQGYATKAALTGDASVEVNLSAGRKPAIAAGAATIGASTAAAGSTTADAGVLPAATGSVYPTTAADDTKGVRVHANDKVAGRVLMIGNGVANKILKVYAPSGGAINGGSADAAFSSVSGKGVIIMCLNATANTWLAW